MSWMEAKLETGAGDEVIVIQWTEVGGMEKSGYLRGGVNQG